MGSMACGIKEINKLRFVKIPGNKTRLAKKIHVGHDNTHIFFALMDDGFSIATNFKKLSGSYVTLLKGCLGSWEYAQAVEAAYQFRLISDKAYNEFLEKCNRSHEVSSRAYQVECIEEYMKELGLGVPKSLAQEFKKIKNEKKAWEAEWR